MPYITINEDEDWLKAYQRYRKTVWYKRIPKSYFLFGGIALGCGGASFAILSPYTDTILTYVLNPFALMSLVGGG